MYIKDEKGITLIVLIVTVIIMLILISVGASSGIESYKHAQVNNFVHEMQLIQARVDEIDYNKEKPETWGDAVQDTSTLNTIISEEKLLGTNINDWRYFKQTEKELESQLNIENITEDIAINFKTREVIGLTGVEYKNVKHYTQYNLPGGQQVIQKTDNTQDLSFNLQTEVNGLNATLTITNIKRGEKEISNGILKYKLLSDEYISNIKSEDKTYENYTNDVIDTWHTIKGNMFSVSQSGRYVIALTDSQESTPCLKEEIIILTNAPNLQDGMNKNLDENGEWSYKYFDGENATFESGAYATFNDKTYLWIPRYAYNYQDTNLEKIKFLKGNSNITTDNKILDNGWNIPVQFTDSSINQEYRGIWLNVTNISNFDLESILVEMSSSQDIIPVI